MLKLTPNSSINTVMTHCRYALYDAMLSAFMPKPPVPAVPRACTTLSNTGIPPARRRTVSKSVSTM